MVPYWLLFSIPCALALTSRPEFVQRRDINMALWFFGLFLILMIAFRWKVGSDWGSEISYMNRAEYRPFLEAIRLTDPGFGAIVWLCSQTPFNVWISNFCCGLIFTVGLIVFCRNEPHPWLALTIAVPYLVIVVGMGYNRQSTAIGLMMIALVKLQQRSIISFYIYMFLAGTLHSSAVLMFPLGIIGSRINKAVALVVGAPFFAIAFSYVLQDKVDDYLTGYVKQEYLSAGALVRQIMNAIPALIFMVKGKTFYLTDSQRKIGNALCIAAIFFLFCNFAFPSAVWVDRMALYVIPIQMFVLGRLPAATARSWSEYRALSFAVVCYSAAVMMVWLLYAVNATEWLPYQMFPIEQLYGRDAGGPRV